MHYRYLGLLIGFIGFIMLNLLVPIFSLLLPGGIFYNAAVHDIDIISLLLGESAPDTIFSLGHAFCAGKTSWIGDIVLDVLVS